MEDCESAILTFLSSAEDACIEDTYPWAIEHKLDPLAVVGAVNSLLTEGYVASSDLATSFFTVTEEGKTVLKNGTQEMMVLKAIVAAGKLSMPDLQAAVGKDAAKIGMGNCMKSKWIKKDGADLVPLVKAEEVEDTVQQYLQALVDGGYATDAIDDKVSSVALSWSGLYLNG